ncbi:MAG: DUF2007 domain-containing protein [Gammaproteobacteria bacterium]|nr:DUF2007 domain-containing protein [Gammaproteobacteria bacterium]
MTPIYRSPDRDQAKAIQSLLLGHNIQTSVIESKKSEHQFSSYTVIWHEVWLRSYADVNRAKAIITQYEFTRFKTNMSAVRSASPILNGALKAQNTVDEYPLTDAFDNDDDVLIHEPPVAFAQKRRDNLIPINNKRVFKRLGLLLGYTEEQIEKFDSNKLYRPWDAGTLMERVKNLKQKCS